MARQLADIALGVRFAEVGHIPSRRHSAVHLEHGGEYRIPDYQDLEAFNWSEYEQRRGQPYTEIYAAWDGFRTRIKEVVATFTPEQLAGTTRYPAGNLGNCAQLIREVWEHDGSHFNDIFAALER